MSKKLSTKEFIEDAIKVHGDFYDYSKTIYLRAHDKIIITCPIHGDFEQNANAHKNGQGCFECGKKSRVKVPVNERSENFIRKSKKIHNNFYNYSLVEYKGINKKVKIICPDHGVFIQTPVHHINGVKCPKCANEQRIIKRTKTTKQFINDAKSVCGNFYDYSKVKYFNSKEKVIIICPNHGDFLIRPNDLLKSVGCRKCYNERRKDTIGGYSWNFFNSYPDKKDNMALLYLVYVNRISNNKQFLKIGITTSDIKTRYQSGYNNFDIKEIYSYKTNLFNCFKLEQHIKNKFNSFRTYPGDFVGYTECFNVEIKDKILEELSLPYQIN